jgi:cytochrome c oxidase accessory protein FixG
MAFPSITSKRRLVQALLIVSTLLIPFVTIGGNPIFRIDIGLRTLFMAGVAVRVDQFYLVLLATLFTIVAFLLLTVILGRVWCGWLCPQTVFNDLAEMIGCSFKRKLSPSVSKIIEHLTALVISKLIAFNLLCWFIPPGLLVSRLMNFYGQPLLFSCFIGMTLFGYLNLIIVKRSFCLSYCPYGRFQAALMDSGTLNLAFLEETRHLCLRCGACVRTCPMQIDIRDGFQIECIGCGRCIDACRGVMAKRPDGIGLIDYRFGEVKGTRVRFGSKALALTFLSLLLGVALIWGLLGRDQNAFAVQRIASVEPRLMPDGFQMQPWRATIGNRSESPKNYRIRIVAAEADEISLLGPVSDIRIPANEHIEVTFVIRHKRSGNRTSASQLLLIDGGKTVAMLTIKP